MRLTKLLYTIGCKTNNNLVLKNDSRLKRNNFVEIETFDNIKITVCICKGIVMRVVEPRALISAINE